MTAVAANRAEVEADLARFFAFDDEFIQDPYPLYARTREHAPVSRIGPVVVVSRYEDVKQVFRDPDNFSNVRSRGSRVSTRRAELDGQDLERYNWLIESDIQAIGQQDEPNHTRLRRFVNDAFSSEKIATYRADVQTLADELLDEIEADGRSPFDLARYSHRVPFLWMSRMLAVPSLEIAQFRAWGLALRIGLGTNHANLDESYDANRNIERFVRDLVARRRAEPEGSSDDLVAQLVRKEVGGAYLDDKELVALFSVMLSSGNTNDVISNGVIALHKYPAQKAQLLADPSLWRNTVEELFRYCPPAHAVHRVAIRDTEIAGFPVYEGESVRMLVGSAGHDPAKFEDPENFDIRRRNARQHVDLGYGIHTCLGQWISRLQIEVALTSLYRRFPDLEVVGPIKYRRNYAFRGTDELLVAPGW